MTILAKVAFLSMRRKDYRIRVVVFSYLFKKESNRVKESCGVILDNHDKKFTKTSLRILKSIKSLPIRRCPKTR